ncbi:hypothetical protein [Sporomusa aerivorans]|uniref:hypothetical protein n=1 Tax=Sporomusa aerivorans TaxID=204936 RepID=UPI00352AE07D
MNEVALNQLASQATEAKIRQRPRNKLKLEIVIPDRVVFSKEIDEASVTLANGHIIALSYNAYIGEKEILALRIKLGERWVIISVFGGFMIARSKKVKVLACSAEIKATVLNDRSSVKV